MNYRPDIDGLRAIAILLVLIYHGGLSLFPSGFIGVDVFFVISGFLITSIIHESLNRNDFSFFDFYNRRLWRLQPVFVALIVVTTLLSLLLYLPDDLIEFSRSARKTSLFISNLFFNKTTTGYFSPDTHQLPLLHTWSLSIEWQCYLILPLVMYALYRFLNKRQVIYVVYGLAILFFLLALHYSQVAPAQTYYQFSSRIFEFLIGSCIALSPRIEFSIKKSILVILGLSALFFIIYTATLDNILLGYPNWHTLFVCLATGFLIALGTNFPSLVIVKTLSFRPLVFIGVLSYSLYIWHWVVFSILRYQTIEERSEVLFIAYSIVFILAYLSWRYIEKPTKRFRYIPFRYTVVILFLLPVLFSHLSSFVIKLHSGYPQRFNQELVRVYKQLKDRESPYRALCIDNTRADNESKCKIGAKEQDGKTGLMIGDSFSNHYWGFMDVLGKAAGVSILAQGTSSCISLPGIYLYDWWHFKDTIYQDCYEQTEKYYRMIQENHYDYVIIGQVWNNYVSAHIINQLGDDYSAELTKKRLADALDKALGVIISSGAKPVLIESTALTHGNLHQCFFKHIKLRQHYDSEECRFTLTRSDNEIWLNQLFDNMRRKYPQLVIIDPKKVQCRDNVCYSDLNGIPVYRDEGHITDYASYQLGYLYLQKFENPLI
ncbi:TPA: acyltransferase [Legionella pneumophila]|uniref:acyltransferase family protein n=1 Tax=Legionella pneumophila TaxID=446 RepID=UPI000787A0EC|nr:acyltransferase family protein [Legionella pneumophila]MDW8880489.1 acyltransferase family protein [Legionella pneumophila subsp. fraseri]MDW8963560.1 acyltransferase family protein [Legionella pneumophila subsp. fraseri]MDW9037292.1 acyltransferase family protein [Legionella pneumophila subsp. fraseri]MDW9040348.1 acyltransferase family protein [Legionella pneumophila subsp. fraseri]MDW9043410.1 acyltransferase family protein [Legionella pneumophila subsp. fraseri]